MSENLWILDALLDLVNSENFQSSAGGFLSVNSKSFCQGKLEDKLNVWALYQTFYQGLLMSFFQELGVSKGFFFFMT